MAVSSSEINDEEDLEAGLLATCRICFQCEGEEDDDLISPCMCKGSHLFVHRSCLDHWRSIKKGFDFSHCTTCKGQFHLRVVELEEDVWRKIKIRLFIARDFIFAFLALQTVIGILGGISYLVDKHEYLRELLNFNTFVTYYSTGFMVFCVLLSSVALVVIFFAIDDNGRIGRCCARSDMDPTFWLLFGMFLCIYVMSGGFICLHVAFEYGASILIQWILNRHNSILAKKELTKEYVVEDLHGCYTPAILNPEHLERLKALELF